MVCPLQLGRPSGPHSTGVQPGAQRGPAACYEALAQGDEAPGLWQPGPQWMQGGSGCLDVFCSRHGSFFSALDLDRSLPSGLIGEEPTQPSRPGGMHTLTHAGKEGRRDRLMKCHLVPITCKAFN